MSQIVNLTDYEAAPLVSTGVDGQWQATAIVKASFVWDDQGQLTKVAPEPVLISDEYAGEPGTSGLLRASELAPPKPKLDVLLVGALVFPQPITEADVELALGNRLRKRARVFGDRVWLPGVAADLVPSQPRRTTRVPIAWERSFGGGDPSDPKHSDPRNPAGSGVAKDPRTLECQGRVNQAQWSSYQPLDSETGCYWRCAGRPCARCRRRCTREGVSHRRISE